MSHSEPHPVPARQISGRLRRRLVGGLLIAVALAGVVGAAGVLTGLFPNPVVAGEPKAAPEAAAPAVPTVKAVRPKRSPNFRVSNTQLATVEPFYQAGLRARVTGVVKFVAKDIGEQVRMGELLAEIDVPDLRQAVEQKEALILQRQEELRGAEADLKTARAAVELAKAAVRQREADLSAAENVRFAKQKRFDRFKVLASTQTVTPDVLDEAELESRAAVSAVRAGEAAVQKAKAELAEKEASLEKAAADIDLRRVVVEVARKDRDAAAVLLGYTRLYAPFDGVIARRTIDPGVFVQGSSSAVTDPLITVARVDFVTVSMRLPDNAAAFVTWNTEATVEFDQLPGVAVRGAVTRFAPAIDPADRTLKVELDVFNGTTADYRALLNRAAAESSLLPIGLPDPLQTLAAAGVGATLVKEDHKGWKEGWAVCPDWGDDPRGRRIVPGITGTMRLDLDRFTEAYLLPASAVFSKGGRTYLLTVADGVTKTVPVVVQVNDGRLVKVAVLAGTGGPQVPRELTGNEVVVVARQLELSDGQPVKAVTEDW